MLTPAQVDHFRAFGYVVISQLWTPAETVLLTDGLKATLREARGGTEYDGKARESVHNWWDIDSPHRVQEGTEGVAEAAFLANDPRLLSKCEQLLGPGFTGSFVRQPPPVPPIPSSPVVASYHWSF
jgi:hypothetical protein